MTQEDKELLLRDLSARLPYGVKINVNGEEDTLLELGVDTGWINASYDIEDVKPYLRSLSSMTEEEKIDILQSLNIHGDIDNEGNLLLGVECDIITLKVCKKYLGELNKRMFDVCHMVEKGLALEAPEGMYNINKKEK